MKIPKALKSIKMKLFVTLTVVVAIIVFLLIFINSVVLEKYYLYSKVNTLLDVYRRVNTYYNSDNKTIDIDLELERISIRNNFEIILKTDEDISIYSSNKNFWDSVSRIAILDNNDNNMIYHRENVQIRTIQDSKTSSNIALLTAKLDNGYKLYIRLSVASIQDSVEISNNLLFLIGTFTVLVGGVVVSIISSKYTNPILQLNNIARRMSNLDFTQKYVETGADDELDNLGKSINIMSDKLQKTINELQKNNIELEKDIEEKSKIDEMRKQFISDVSHELKTPIALIQGYAEGLTENVTTDEESRKFYAEVIQDEANRMDKLVKQLLELMKLEYGKRELNNTEFDITELIKEVIRKTSVMIGNQDVLVKFEPKEPIFVYADDFYIEQVVTNYITNAIKNVEEVNGNKQIVVKVNKNNDKARVEVFNTGEKLKEEDLTRIWKRFYKVDTSRNRENGGTGIGLSFVKAIMTNYGNDFGVYNRDDGVEFYFELDLPKKEKV
ncbi:MAG: GHKL domain-containing protein [Clostridia bacterium]|nr:GHKL domain-containing protein [Clostridia bacterium]